MSDWPTHHQAWVSRWQQVSFPVFRETKERLSALLPGAESVRPAQVAAIVLERYGLKTPSAEYLHAYIDENGLLPEVNIDVISSAVSKIQATLNGEVTCKTGDLYRNDADFAAFIDSI